jgi:hypothetical protein
MQEDLFNGIVLTDGTRAAFKTPVSEKVAVQVIIVRNHPAFDMKMKTKQLVATGLIKAYDVIGLYGGHISYDLSTWNSYQLATSPNAKYCIDASTLGESL